MRFTIRDVLWLMLVVGLACGWWADRYVGAVSRKKLLDREADLMSSLAGEMQFNRFLGDVREYLRRQRVWLTWNGRWYIHTAAPFHYEVPMGTDIERLCNDCLEAKDGEFYRMPPELVHRYGLRELGESESY